MLLDDLVFRLQHYKSEDWELGEDCFIFYKIKPLVDQYLAFWATRPDAHPQCIFELGMWDGGSVAFWFEHFQPKKHVGIDILDREDSPYFRRYVERRGIADRLKTYWHVDQGDAAQLREIVARDFAGVGSTPLDLVLDDASHMYGLTKRGFETLFPLVRPGGLYIIEDWAWAHWDEFASPRHPWATERAMSDLVLQLVEATGSGTDLISSLAVYQGFTVVERGPVAVEKLANFQLDQWIKHRVEISAVQRVVRKAAMRVRAKVRSVRRR